MRIIGIDPGLNGALALFDSHAAVTGIFDMPTYELTRNGKKKREIDTIALANQFDEWSKLVIDHVYIEQVGSMPGQGVSSTFAFGKGFGILLGMIAANFMPHTLITPQAWKKALRVPADKDGARARASQIAPTLAKHWPLVKHDGRAEAFLIATYGATMFSQTAKAAA